MARKVDLERTHHGETVVDPYEWLRASDDPDVLAHLTAENAYAADQTSHLEDLRTAVYDEIVARTQLSDLSVPARRDDWWYYSRTVDGAQYAVYCRCPADAGPDRSTTEAWTPPTIEPGVPADGEQVMLDGNVEAEGHPFFALGALAVSPDGSLLAYSVDTTGDERFTLRVKDLRTSELLPDEVSGIFYSAAWSSDGSTVFYTVVDDAWRPHEVRRHVLGTESSSDTTVFAEPDERYWVGLDVSSSRRFLLVSAASKTTTEVRALDLATPAAEPQLVAERRQGVEYDVDHLTLSGRERFVIVHNHEAEDFAVAIADVGDPDPAHWTPVLDHVRGTRVLGGVALNRALALSIRREGLQRVLVLPVEGDAFGSPWEVQFDEPLFTADVGSMLDPSAPVLRLGYSSFVTPGTVYDLDLASRELLLRKRTPVLGGFSSDDYEQHREWAVASDGTRVPISVVCRVGTPRDGTAPVVIYGYGSYEHSIDPTFTVPRLSLLDRGVVFAVAHVRGGGEMGRHWYEQGRLGQKTNTFTDFVACAERLVESGWAATDRLAAMGGSAGGLLMGAVANLAPERFAGIVAQVPFVDALTTILDPSLPLSVVEWEEWGNPLHDAEAYAYMRGYSPYENIRTDADYPPILAITSLHDTRVLYVEPAKWIARLRETASGGPFLLKTQMDGGHGGASGRYETWKERAYEMAWLLDVLGVAGSQR